ncbi:hypothetical protein ABZ419_02730 [Streptomyces cinnamoneus]|uniref:hypothetical protein n=1 Tax=Streptomyces cinnamoneus TaxID=53446 RepID=UPI0033FF124B
MTIVPDNATAGAEGVRANVRHWEKLSFSEVAKLPGKANPYVCSATAGGQRAARVMQATR